MAHIVEFLPKFQQTRRLLDGGQSVLLYAPKYHGKRRFLDAVRESCQGSGTAGLLVSSLTRLASGRLDYQRLWDETTLQLSGETGVRIAGIEDYKQAFREALSETSSRVVVLLAGARRGNEENHAELLDAFHYLLRNDSGRFVVLATDDYSSYAYRETRPIKSPWVYFEEVHCLSLDKEEIRESLLEYARHLGQTLTPIAANRLALQILKATGGHAGLVLTVVADLASRSWRPPARYWGEYRPEVLRGSHVLLALSEALKEDRWGLCQTALEYREPKVPEKSVRIEILQQLGILQRWRPSVWKLWLCSGAITRMVEEIDEQAKATRPRIGTVLSMEMPRMFLEGDLEFDEQTFVTVHLSDLHVSDKHGFRLPSVRSIQNQNARSVADLLFEDLKALELIGKLDVLIVSGDFVWDGKKNEDFHRAREVIEAILEKTGLGRDRLVMVPGNHDIEWGAGELARATHEHVSRENYDAFSELLRQRRPDQKADLVVIPSRSGSRKLRILELNSTTVEGKAAPGIGYVSSAALDRAGELLQGDDRLNRTEQIKQVITWIVVHHHVFPATSAMQEDAGRKNISVMANADELLYFASRWNVDLILHGHEHQPSVTVACRWPVNRPDELVSPVTVIGVGSIGVHSNYLSPFRRNHYYILYRRPDDIVVRSRCLGDKGVMFGSHGDLFLSR